MRPLVLPATLLIALASCSGTPQPNPPALDVSRIGTMRSTRLFGIAGALDPDAELWITPLDRSEDPVVVIPEADGSFAAPALDGERHRLQPLLRAPGDDEALRGPPVDIGVTDGVRLLGPVSACWHLVSDARLPPAPVGGASESVIAIENECDTALVLSGAAPRRAGDFSVIDAPAEIPPGGRGELVVGFAPSVAAEREEVLAIDVSAPELERRWVTVHALGRRP